MHLPLLSSYIDRRIRELDGQTRQQAALGAIWAMGFLCGALSVSMALACLYVITHT